MNSCIQRFGKKIVVIEDLSRHRLIAVNQVLSRLWQKAMLHGDKAGEHVLSPYILRPLWLSRGLGEYWAVVVTQRGSSLIVGSHATLSHASSMWLQSNLESRYIQVEGVECTFVISSVSIHE